MSSDAERTKSSTWAVRVAIGCAGSSYAHHMVSAIFRRLGEAVLADWAHACAIVAVIAVPVALVAAAILKSESM